MDLAKWEERWPDFKPEEVLSPIGMKYLKLGIILVSGFAMDQLQAFRRIVDREVLVNHAGLRFRGYRHPEENLKVGGRYASFHVQGIAFDVTIRGMTPKEVADEAQAFGWVGIGIYDTFTHLDLRTNLDSTVTIWQEGLVVE